MENDKIDLFSIQPLDDYILVINWLIKNHISFEEWPEEYQHIASLSENENTSS